MTKKHKICILGTQRTGSSIATEIIETSSFFKECRIPVANLYEPFCKFPFHEYSIIDGLINVKVLSSKVEFQLYEKERYTEYLNANLNLIFGTNSEQPVIFKVLAEADQLLPLIKIKQIIETAKNNDFTIFYIRRHDIERQLLSMAVASSLNTFISSKQNKKEKITISEKDFEACRWLCGEIFHFDRIAKETNAIPLFYETLEKDLANYGFTSPTRKISYREDLHELIINFDAVKERILQIIHSETMKTHLKN